MELWTIVPLVSARRSVYKNSSDSCRLGLDPIVDNTSINLPKSQQLHVALSTSFLAAMVVWGS